MNYKISEILELLLRGDDLDESLARELMTSWLNNQIMPVQTGALLSGFRSKGVTGFELASMAEVLLNACKFITLPDLFVRLSTSRNPPE